MADSCIPKKVNPINLAKSGERISGSVDIAKVMDRLNSMLVEGDEPATIGYELDFGVDAGGRVYIKGHVKGNLRMTCQRCMQPMVLDIDSNFALSPVAEDAPEIELPKEYEPLVLESDMVIPAQILEDELLLCIPYAPMHAEKCKEDFKCETDNSRTPQADNPFRVLKDL